MFHKDEEGCVPADELKFVLQYLPAKVQKLKILLNWINLPLIIQMKLDEINEMIETVDKNGDGKISYSEFRVMMGAIPLVMD